MVRRSQRRARATQLGHPRCEQEDCDEDERCGGEGSENGSHRRDPGIHDRDRRPQQHRSRDQRPGPSTGDALEDLRGQYGPETADQDEMERRAEAWHSHEGKLQQQEQSRRHQRRRERKYHDVASGVVPGDEKLGTVREHSE